MKPIAKILIAALLLAGAPGCKGNVYTGSILVEEAPPPEDDHFQQVIAPILEKRCTNSRGGPCHVDDGTGRAQGNLDLSSYEGVTRRPDVLRRFGSYPFPLLLMKGVADPPAVALPIIGDAAPLFIRHAGGAPLEMNDEAFTELDRWLRAGATRDGLPPRAPVYGRGPCSPDVREDLFTQSTATCICSPPPEAR